MLFKKFRLTRLANRAAKARSRLNGTIAGKVLKEHDENAARFISARLREIEEECRSGQLKPAEDRYPEMARFVVEYDSAILPESLGGELIVVEERYRRA